MDFKLLILILILSLNFICLAQINESSEGLYPVFIKGKYGYINSKGEMIIQPQFNKANGFHNGLALVTIGAENISTTPGHFDYIGGKQGYINKKGAFIIPLGKYYLANDFSDGLAGVGINCKTGYCFGYIDTKGQVVIKPQFQTVGQFYEGTAEVRMPNDKWGVIDKTGEFIIPPIYDASTPFFEGIGIGMYIKNKKKLPSEQKISDFGAVFYNKEGKIIARIPYFVYGRFNEGLVLILTEKGTGFIDKTGKIIIEPKFRNALSFSEGLCPVKIDNNWGYIDKTGEIVISPTYDLAFMFSNGLAKVNIKGKFGFIDKTGKLIIEPQDWDISNFSDELAFVRQQNYSGYVNKSGKFIWKQKDE